MLIRRKVMVNSVKRRFPVSSKWTKTQVMKADRSLRQYIPVTKKMSKKTLIGMLRSYGMVYVKPSVGSLGRGVMKVERLGDEAVGRAGEYAYQIGGRKREFASYEAMYRSIKKDAKGKVYVAQKGIQPLKHEGRPFDLRIVVQRTPSGGWEATGIVGRIAFPGRIVTNGSQGGTILPAEQVLQPYTNYMGRKHLIKRLEQIGVDTIKRMHRVYPRIREIGLDVALDYELRPWILEVNTTPDHCPFAILSDPTMINKIIRYGAAYGQTYKLKCHKA